ncbi:MAG: phosphatase PAP2 family protein [Saprospiraceae bacterium]|nr:phosphatase PAP2 family protein [Saprospiraceae bacterium]
MLTIIQQNKMYFASYFLIFVIVFIWQFQYEWLDAFFIFSNNRTPFGDVFFKLWTHLGEEYPFIIFTIFFLIIGEKYWAWQIAMGGLVVLSVSLGLKELFAVPRPAAVLESLGILSDINTVEGVTLLKGSTSFPSGHSAGGFCIWTLLAFRFLGNPVAQIACLITAVLVALSRVYLILHFPDDTLFGSAIGVAVAIVVHHFLQEKPIIGVNKTKVIAVHTVTPE